ncbi:MAG: peroxiredoxin [Pelagibacterales bacterium]|nr:peroxiredoxin [Pelagibacterales bacterium]|tara:strand:- start:6719 stop:7204 length:486 start_codon:yes stop_codon:yes gene_type:complete
MAIKVGDKIPDATLKCIGPDGIINIEVGKYFANKKIVLFSVPGAFTPTCSAKHLPGFVEYYSDILSKGVDEIICISVNDPFVMNAWEKDQNSKGKVTLLADGNGDFTEALGLSFDGSGFGLGKRGQRFVIIIDNGTIVHLAIEKAGSFEVSSAESVLKALD